MKQVYIEPVIKTTELDSTELLAGSGMTGQIDQDIEIDYGGEDDGTHEPDAKINFTDIWDDDEDTENDIWDSL
jgi:hypothetical protein